MEYSDIIEVLNPHPARSDAPDPTEDHQEALLPPGFYLALPRRHRQRKKRPPLLTSPTLIGPVASAAAARMLKVSAAYLGLDRETAAVPRSRMDHGFVPPFGFGRTITQARVV